MIARLMDRSYLGVLVGFNLLNAFDALTTWVGTGVCGYVEANAYFAQLLAASEPLAYVLKIAMIAAFSLLLYRMRWIARWRSRRASVFLFSITAACAVVLLLVVLSNTLHLVDCFT